MTYAEAVEKIDRLIELNREKEDVLKRLRLCLTIRGEFPDNYKDQKFFVITQKEYSKRFIYDFRHGMFVIKKAKDRRGDGVIIGRVTNKLEEYKIVPYFELPVMKNNVVKL